MKLTLEKFETAQQYGFFITSDDGASLPKGMISSYRVERTGYSNGGQIEFSVQSPTGDSSDFHNFSHAVSDYNQGKYIVLQWQLLMLGQHLLSHSVTVKELALNSDSN